MAALTREGRQHLPSPTEFVGCGVARSEVRTEVVQQPRVVIERGQPHLQALILYAAQAAYRRKQQAIAAVGVGGEVPQQRADRAAGPDPTMPHEGALGVDPPVILRYRDEVGWEGGPPRGVWLR